MVRGCKGYPGGQPLVKAWSPRPNINIRLKASELSWASDRKAHITKMDLPEDPILLNPRVSHKFPYWRAFLSQTNPKFYWYESNIDNLYGHTYWLYSCIMPYPHAIPILSLLKDNFLSTFPSKKYNTWIHFGLWASTGASTLGASVLRGFQPGHQTYYQVTRWRIMAHDLFTSHGEFDIMSSQDVAQKKKTLKPIRDQAPYYHTVPVWTHSKDYLHIMFPYHMAELSWRMFPMESTWIYHLPFWIQSSNLRRRNPFGSSRRMRLGQWPGLAEISLPTHQAHHGFEVRSIVPKIAS